jgi:Rps23 Pro-64 3,4-dihydroxylase Tpa1-like proline 4-hydroxylase|tara:strand:- start:189 stop:746 length:558 start_codon:yes stop_codon:yes gene_type:complete
MDHLETILELKKALSPEFIKRMIPIINHKAKDYLQIQTAGGTVDKKIRNVKGYSLNCNGTPTDLFYWNFVKAEIFRLYLLYKSKFPHLITNNLNQVDLLKYKVGGKYEVHIDQYTNIPRVLSIIMNLNDEYEGGDLVFTDQQSNEIKKIKLGMGSIVFFPSNFMYPHTIKPITKGTRYSIVSWLQ